MEGSGKQVYDLYSQLRSPGIPAFLKLWSGIDGLKYFTLSHHPLKAYFTSTSCHHTRLSEEKMEKKNYPCSTQPWFKLPRGCQDVHVC